MILFSVIVLQQEVTYRLEDDVHMLSPCCRQHLVCQYCFRVFDNFTPQLRLLPVNTLAQLSFSIRYQVLAPAASHISSKRPVTVYHSME
jgi:hypothetical protein